MKSRELAHDVKSTSIAIVYSRRLCFSGKFGNQIGQNDVIRRIT